MRNRDGAAASTRIPRRRWRQRPPTYPPSLQDHTTCIFWNGPKDWPQPCPHCSMTINFKSSFPCLFLIDYKYNNVVHLSPREVELSSVMAATVTTRWEQDKHLITTLPGCCHHAHIVVIMYCEEQLSSVVATATMICLCQFPGPWDQSHTQWPELG